MVNQSNPDQIHISGTIGLIEYNYRMQPERLFSFFFIMSRSGHPENDPNRVNKQAILAVSIGPKTQKLDGSGRATTNKLTKKDPRAKSERWGKKQARLQHSMRYESKWELRKTRRTPLLIRIWISTGVDRVTNKHGLVCCDNCAKCVIQINNSVKVAFIQQANLIVRSINQDLVSNGSHRKRSTNLSNQVEKPW